LGVTDCVGILIMEINIGCSQEITVALTCRPAVIACLNHANVRFPTGKRQLFFCLCNVNLVNMEISQTCKVDRALRNLENEIFRMERDFGLSSQVEYYLIPCYLIREEITSTSSALRPFTKSQFVERYLRSLEDQLICDAEAGHDSARLILEHVDVLRNVIGECTSELCG